MNPVCPACGLRLLANLDLVGCGQVHPELTGLHPCEHCGATLTILSLEEIVVTDVRRLDGLSPVARFVLQWLTRAMLMVASRVAAHN